MGFFKKLGDLARSNLNNLLDELEDPQKMADQAMIDLAESKKKAQGLMIKAQARIMLLEKNLLKLRTVAMELLAEAERSLLGADEEKARSVLEQKQAISQEKLFLEQELKEQQETILTIKSGLKAIDAKIEELKLSAKSIALNTIEKEDAFSGFSRMEEKIDMREAELLALDELFLEEQKKDAKPVTPFDKHSDPEALERELLALKKKLNSK